MIQEIPLKPSAQTLRCSIGGTFCNLTITWRGNGYILDIADTNKSPIVSGLSLVTGADLLAQLKHLGITGALVILSDSDPSQVPLYDTLGISSHLCVIT